VRRVDVAIIGAGFAGLAMALRLQKENRGSFVVIERASEIGGTWRENTYPGVACDVPSHLYCFADHPNPTWESVYAGGHEIRSYLNRVIDRQGLRSHIMLQTSLTSAHRSGAEWVLELAGPTMEVLHANNLVVACGRLTEPRIPQVPGLESFPGAIVHTSRWDHSVQLRDRRVAVVGTGASAIQLVPELVRRGAEVTLFQRTPAWIVPRDDHKYTACDHAAFAASKRDLSMLREALLSEGEARFASRSGDPHAAKEATEGALLHLRSQVSDTSLRRALTPDYAFGCKRVLLSDDFYPAIASGQVALEDSALSRVDGRRLHAASGNTHEADLLVLATGFEATQQPYSSMIHGEAGQSLADHWQFGMTSFASTLVSGFPDLYVLNGPNASLGHNSAILMIEEQVAFVSRCLASRDATQGSSIRVPEELEDAYTSEIGRRSADTPWVAGGCTNWYVDGRSGRLTLLWPGTVQQFHERLAESDISLLTTAQTKGLT
jgi:cation diffusion facilitator CzcD-associated flavoprotein CzcO